MTTEEQEAHKEVAQFREIFYRKFGIYPTITFDLSKPPLIPLIIIESAANAVLNTMGSQYYKKGIRTLWHDTNVLICLQCFCKIALDSGNMQSRTARYLTQSPPLVAYGRGRINTLIKEKNERAIKTYGKIKTEIERLLFRDLETS